MKKLFISVPMKGRTDEAIKASREDMHKLAEIMFGEELEVLNTTISNKAPECNKQAVWYLGNSIAILSQADYFIGVDYSDVFTGCNIERDVARNYGIPTVTVCRNQLNSLSDAAMIERQRWDNPVAVCEG